MTDQTTAEVAYEHTRGMTMFFETYDEAQDYIAQQATTGLRIHTHYDARRNCYEVTAS